MKPKQIEIAVLIFVIALMIALSFSASTTKLFGGW